MRLSIAVTAAIAATAFAAGPSLALPSQATVGAGLGFVSACSGTTYGSGISPGQVILGGVSNGSQSCGYAVSSTVGGAATVSVSSAGGGATPFSNAASATAGVGAIHLLATNVGSSADYFPGAQAVGGWNETFDFKNGPIGQPDIWIAPLTVSGALSADGAYPAASGFSVVAFENGSRLSHYDAPTYAAFLAHNPAMPYSDNNFYQFDQGETWALEDTGADGAVVISQTVNFAIPFIYGTPFTVGFYGQVLAAEDSYGNDTNLNSSGADFAHTITWGGKGYVVAADGSGPHVTDFTISSTSGFDYSQPYVDPIPEPSTWAIMVLGFGLAGAASRRRRAPSVSAVLR